MKIDSQKAMQGYVEQYLPRHPNVGFNGSDTYTLGLKIADKILLASAECSGNLSYTAFPILQANIGVRKIERSPVEITCGIDLTLRLGAFFSDQFSFKKVGPFRCVQHSLFNPMRTFLTNHFLENLSALK